MTPTYRFNSGPDEQAPDPPGWVDGAPTSASGQRCVFCGDRNVTWVHALDQSKTTYRAWGKGHTLPSFWALCDRCESLYQSRDDEALVALMSAGSPSVRDLDEDARKPLRVFRDADKGARRFADPHPELVRLGEQGYEPLHAYTGAGGDLGPIWPEEHRVALPPEIEPDEDQRWLVRSPWTSITVQEVLELMWAWVERPTRGTSDLRLRIEGAAEVFGWPQERAQEWLAACRADENGDGPCHALAAARPPDRQGTSWTSSTWEMSKPSALAACNTTVSWP